MVVPALHRLIPSLPAVKVVIVVGIGFGREGASAVSHVFFFLLDALGVSAR